MKKKNFLNVLLVFLLVGFSLQTCFKSSALAADKQVIKWNLQTAYSMSSLVTNHATEWAEAMERITDGRLQVKIHPSGAFCSPAEMITYLNRGSFDAAITYGGYYTGSIPETNLEAAMPMAFQSLFEVWDFMEMRGFYDIIQDSYAERGVRYFYAPSDCYYSLGTNFAIESIDDIAGKKIRATGLMGEFLEELGASVTVIPGSELYMALKLGTIDGAVWGAGTFLPENMNEVMDYWVQSPTLGHSNACLLVSQKSLDELPSDLRAIVEDSTQYILLDTALQYFRESEDMRLTLEEKTDTKMVHLPEEDVEKMMKEAVPLWDELAKENDKAAKGVEILKEQLRYYGRLK